MYSAMSNVAESFYLILHPRPAYLIGSGRVGEVANFMAASWVAPVSEDPPRLAVAVGIDSYTYELIKRYGEFTVNVYPVEKIDVIYACGSMSGRKVDKISKLGLEAIKGRHVSAPILKDAIAAIECKVWQLVGSGDAALILGDVVDIHITEFFDEDRGWDFRRINIPLHNWGRGFYTVGRFVLARRARKP